MFYIPSHPLRVEETDMLTEVQCTLPLEMARTLLTLVKGVQQMAGEDGYYGFICRCCDTRFAYEGEAKHEAGCLVPLAEKLLPDLAVLEAYLQTQDHTEEILRKQP